ncbi:MAG: prepilin-type N-terminal cleavage/methylation domain-containing protein [Candidatus Peregrinibacteria bacterium]
MITTTHRKRDGFTLIELIVVVAIIAIIAGTIFVAIDPGKRLHVSRNARRWADSTTIVKAVKLYEADNSTIPSSIDTASGSLQMLGTNTAGACPATASAAGSCVVGGITMTFPASNCIIDLTSTLRPYLKGIPLDPGTLATAGTTRYFVNRDNGVVWAGSCDAEAEGPGGVGGTTPTVQVSQ